MENPVACALALPRGGLFQLLLPTTSPPAPSCTIPTGFQSSKGERAKDRGGIATRRPSRSLSYAILALAVLSASASAVLFRLSSASAEAPLTVAFYRLSFSVILLAGPLLWRRRAALAGLTLRTAALCGLSGLFLALHFAAWHTSLNYTSVAASTVLVTTHPFMVLAFSYLVWKQRVGAVALAGVILALAGTALVGWGDVAVGLEALVGDLFALLGAAAMAGYLLVGRAVRQTVNVLTYSTLTYSVAAITLLVAAASLGEPLTGFPPQDWLIFTGLAVFPTLFGHTLFNWALGHLPASLISVTIVGEPVGASILAWFIWQQLPAPLTMLGGLLILAGIGLFVLYSDRT